MGVRHGNEEFTIWGGLRGSLSLGLHVARTRKALLVNHSLLHHKALPLLASAVLEPDADLGLAQAETLGQQLPLFKGG